MIVFRDKKRRERERERKGRQKGMKQRGQSINQSINLVEVLDLLREEGAFPPRKGGGKVASEPGLTESTMRVDDDLLSVLASGLELGAHVLEELSDREDELVLLFDQAADDLSSTREE